jgi:hypothetical protein
MSTFKDLMKNHHGATIICGLTGKVVRRLAVIGDILDIDAITDSIGVSMDTTIGFDKWFMDRGSLTFASSEVPQGCKLCTEYDRIVFEDDTGGTIVIDHVTRDIAIT